jgi:hypothetical protein
MAPTLPPPPPPPNKDLWYRPATYSLLHDVACMVPDLQNKSPFRIKSKSSLPRHKTPLLHHLNTLQQFTSYFSALSFNISNPHHVYVSADLSRKFVALCKYLCATLSTPRQDVRTIPLSHCFIKITRGKNLIGTHRIGEKDNCPFRSVFAARAM